MLYNNKTITTDRLILRPFLISDAENVANLCNNYNLYKNTLHLPYPYTINSALSWIETHEKNFNEDKLYEFAITCKESGKLFGAISLSNNKNYNNGEIGYWLGEEFWGKGYATEAAKGILEFAFNIKNYHKVYGRFFSRNPASGKVMTKIGMTYEGTLKDQVKKEKAYLDIVCYGIINSKLYKIK